MCISVSHIKAYRLEHQITKEGPFQSSNRNDVFSRSELRILDALADDANCSDDAIDIFKDIMEDGDIIEGTPEGEIFTACSTIENLQSWFGYYMDSLLQMGFCIFELTLAEGSYVIGNSGTQIGFIQSGILSKIKTNLYATINA